PDIKPACFKYVNVSRWIESLQTSESIAEHTNVFEQDLSQLIERLKEFVFLDIHGKIDPEKLESYRTMAETCFPQSQYYHQIRGGAMSSPLTLTIANRYMFFFERNIVKQIRHAGGLYLRYIDDMFIIINWPERHLNKQIDQWNTLDSNIQLKAEAGQPINFLDIYIENANADLFTKVYHKPSYEPYYLPFNSVHPLHMKKNIPFAMFLRAIRYCSTFKAFLDEREDLRMALLLNKYPGKFIDNQFNRVLKKCNITQLLTSNNYNTIRKNIIYNIIEEEKIPTDHYRTLFIHFTYCLNIRTLPTKFHTLWNKYFSESPINEIIPVIGTRNVQNLQKQ
ncbi:unnamed protein product, partial [Rotaria magnacalcarata]